MGYTTKNYHAHGGAEWGVGGKLTFLPGAVIEGADGLFEEAETAPALPYMADSEATTVEELRGSFNALLGALRTAGIMAAQEEETQTDESELPGDDG